MQNIVAAGRMPDIRDLIQRNQRAVLRPNRQIGYRFRLLLLIPAQRHRDIVNLVALDVFTDNLGFVGRLQGIDNLRGHHAPEAELVEIQLDLQHGVPGGERNCTSAAPAMPRIIAATACALSSSSFRSLP